MTPVPAALLFACAVAAAPVAVAAPADAHPPASADQGSPSGQIAKQLDHGFCNGLQNAHAYPSRQVKILLGRCESMSQTYTSTSPGPSKGQNSNCGGYAVTFGQPGHLNPNLHQITMTGEWADQPLTTAQDCGKARITALAWGERCTSAACDVTVWDRIEGSPRRRHGKWDAATGKCTLELKFTSEDVNYRTLSIDVYTDFPQGNEYVRKKAKGSIVAAKKRECVNAGTGQTATKGTGADCSRSSRAPTSSCLSAPAPAPPSGS